MNITGKFTIKLFFLLAILLFTEIQVDAASRYWAGTTRTFSTTANWCTNAPTACGNCNGYPAPAAPTTNDDIYLAANCDNDLLIDSTITLGIVTLPAGYTGIVTQNGAITTSYITMASGTWVQNAAITTTSTNYDFSFSGGTFTGGSANITIAKGLNLTGGTFTSTSGTLSATGASTFGASNTFNHNSGTVTLKDDVDINKASIFNNVIVDSSPGWMYFHTGSVDQVFLGSLTVIGSNNIYFDECASTRLYVKGDLILSGFSSTGFDCPVTFNGSTATQLYKDVTGTTKVTKSLIINKSSGIVNLGHAWTVDSDGMTVTAGALDFNGNNISSGGAYITVQAGGILQLQGAETVSGTIVFNDNSKVKYDGTASTYTIANWAEFTDADTVEIDLEIAGGSTSVFTLPAAFNDVNDLTITSGIFSLGGYNLTMDGTFSNSATFRQRGAETISGLTQDTNSGTWEYVGDGDSAGDSYNVANYGTSADYYNLKINSTDSADSYSASAIALAVNGTFTLAGGTFTAPSAGNSFYVTGNFTKSGGTFTHNSATTTLDGTSQTITGSIGFYNLTKTVSATDTLTFSASSTTTVTGTLTLDGGASCSTLLLLRPASGTAEIDVSGGTPAVTDVDIENVTSTATAAVTGNYISAGTTTNWDFTGGTDCNAGPPPGGRRVILGSSPKSCPLCFSQALKSNNKNSASVL